MDQDMENINFHAQYLHNHSLYSNKTVKTLIF